MSWPTRLSAALAIVTLAWAACSGQPSLAPIGGSCTTDSDCMAGLLCEGDLCVSAPGGCTTDSDCSACYVCDAAASFCVNDGPPCGAGGAGWAGGAGGASVAGTGGAGGMGAGSGGGGGKGTGGAGGSGAGTGGITVDGG